VNTEILAGIPDRIKELREILELTTAEVAQKIDVPESEYMDYEVGKRDIPISKLFEIANVLDIDFTVLLTGENPRMDSYSVTRNGKGAKIARYPGYDFSALATNFMERKMEPLLVELSANNPPAPLVMHSGQEFNYVTEGKVKIVIGNKELILEKGDCIYFDPNLPHGQFTVDGDAKFITVILE